MPLDTSTRASLQLPGSDPMRTSLRLIDVCDRPIALVDSGGVVVYANESWWRMVGDRPAAGSKCQLFDFVSFVTERPDDASLGDEWSGHVRLLDRGDRHAVLDLLPRDGEYQVAVVQFEDDEQDGEQDDEQLDESPQSKCLINSKQHLQSIIDSIPADVAWIGSDLCYRGVNQHLCETIGMSAEEIVGQKVGFLAKRDDTIGVSDDIAEFVRWFFESNQQRASREWVGRLVSTRTDLQNFAIYGRKYGDGDEAVFINIDITNRRRENELNRFQNRILGQLIQKSPLHDTLSEISEGLVDLLPGRRCAVLINDVLTRDVSLDSSSSLGDETGKFEVISYKDLKRLKKDLVERFGSSDLSMVEENNSQVHGDLSAIMEALGDVNQSAWLCPLPDDSEHRRGAILVIGSDPDEPREFTQRLLKASTRLAELSVRHDQANRKLLAHQNHLENLVENSWHELRESEARFHNIAEWAPVMIWMSDKVGNVTYSNQMSREFTGFETISDMDQNWRDLLHPDDHDRICLDLERVLGSGSHYESTWRLKRKDGEVRWVVTWLVPRLDRDGNSIGMVGSSTDITDQLRAEEATRQLGMIVESSNNAIIGQDLDNRIVSWNRAAQDLYGYTQEEAIGQKYEIVVPKDRLSELGIINRSALTGQGLRNLETVRTRKDGRTVHVQMSVAPIKDLTGRLVGISSTTVDITEQKVAEQALHESEHRFRSLFETAGDSIFVIDHSGYIVDANRQACDSLLRSRHELVGSSIGSFSRRQREEWESGQLQGGNDSPSDLPEVLASMKPNIPSTLNLLHERSDGVLVPVELRCVRTSLDSTGYILGIARDLTDRHKSEAALRQSEQRYRTLFEYASDLILGLGANGSLSFMNPEWMQKLGLDPERTTDYTIEDFIVPESLGAVRLRLSACDSGSQPEGVEITLRTQDGCLIVVEGSFSCEMENGKALSHRGIFRDVTQQREVDRIKDDLISTVSHELRTPLTSLRGYSELLLDRDMSKHRVKEYVQIIHHETLRLNRLINDLLDIRKLEAEGHDYHLEPLDLNEVLTDVVRLFSEAEPTARIQLESNERLLTIGDADRLRQVFTNLLSNAIKVSEKDSPIVVSVEVTEGRMIISVTDFGIGIPEHAVVALFKKFSRVESPEHQNVKGTGLGLALAQEIVTAHRGQIWVESRYGQGSTFFVSLPVGRSVRSSAASVDGEA